MTTEHFRENIVPTLPTQPGIYKFITQNDTILYVGKAKNLKNRLNSYFGDKKHMLSKTRAMVKIAARIEFIIVNTEQDALLLESTLIREHQPRYNVMLKDGKTYPYICIKNERFPRVFLTRRVVRDGSTYFGPYVQVNRAQVVMDLIQQLFPLRTCLFDLSEENIEKGKYKVCLEYHIKNCKGACVGFEKEDEYNNKIAQIKNLLKGQLGAVRTHLKSEMQRYATELAFEKAQMEKNRLSILEDYQGKSAVVSAVIRDVDVFSIAGDEKEAFVNYLKVVEGAIIHTFTLELTKNLNQEDSDLLEFAVPLLREKFNSHSDEIIVPIPIILLEKNLKITIPQVGDKKKLLELSEKNAKYQLLQRQKDEVSKAQKQTSAERILKTLQEDLHMEELPFHIECFDNSNLQGTNPVSSCVVFKNAKPANRDYRHYNVKTVVGPNDFASMEEVVFRRYKRLLAEAAPLPQLVIIDGGKGQLSAAMKSLEALGLVGKMTVIGIAKRLEEIFFPNDSVPLYINKKSESLKLIQQARNEAHRFGITFHRNQRSKNFITTKLTDIPNIGEKTAEKLLQHFESVTKLRDASQEAIALVVGKVNAAKIRLFFDGEDVE
jgi:excinuclease ABC subunit C